MTLLSENTVQILLKYDSFIDQRVSVLSRHEVLFQPGTVCSDSQPIGPSPKAQLRHRLRI